MWSPVQHPVPESLLEPYNIEVVQRLLVLFLNMPMGGPRAAVLDLRCFADIVRGPPARDQGADSKTLDQKRDAQELSWVLDRFPWVDSLRWWCDEPPLRVSLARTLKISTPPVSLFERARAAVQCIDLSQSGWEYCKWPFRSA